ncbi:hypothetical protein [uncultured Williamsia sp.]|uniref:hypothetical protein n=1 Tax=uncultured Williamsia sp. TaxID=259311 RepID=UPI00262902B9|nr:hypothetical protein [uncultured Williamsia sp.]
MTTTGAGQSSGATASPTASAAPSITPSVSADTYLAESEGSRGWYFITPSGKWRCAILPTLAAAGCQPSTNTGPSIGVPGEPAAVPNPVGTTSRPNAIWIQKGRDAQFTYRGQADFWRFPLEQTPVLPYGRQLGADGFACNTSTAGVSCGDKTTGKGFTFSDSGYVWRYTPVGTSAQMPTPTAASVDFTGEWVGHGRLIDLQPDGTATVKLASGASNGSTWDATWRPTESSFRLVFTTETQRFGDGAGGISAGETWIGSLTSAEGARVLVFSDAPTTYWCREADQMSGVCGA